MAINQTLRQRLAQLGYSTDEELTVWRQRWKSEGKRYFWAYLKNEEEIAAEYRRWFPRLHQFGSECRQIIPVPETATFSAVEREQFRVLLSKMQTFAASADQHCVVKERPNRAAVVSTTLIGLSAAREVFGGTGAVLLTEEERQRWETEVYHPDGDAYWWCAFAWWTLREGLPDEDAEDVRRRFPIPKGSSYWVVVSGVQWGGLAGGAKHEIWRWDGERAEFLTPFWDITY